MLSDDELVELGRCRPSNLHPWGIGTTREIFLTAARAIESAACAERDARIAELGRQLQAYEEHGVTCQTFRHFVSEPCAECNSPGRCAKQLEQQLAEARKDAELLDGLDGLLQDGTLTLGRRVLRIFGEQYGKGSADFLHGWLSLLPGGIAGALVQVRQRRTRC